MADRGTLIFTASMLLLALTWTPSAHAYIDGGTASMIFQMLIAGGLAAMLTMKSFWVQVKARFNSFVGKTPPIDEKH